MQNGRSNEGTNDLPQAGRGEVGCSRGSLLPSGQLLGRGSVASGLVLPASVSMRLARLVSHLASHAEHPKRTSAERGATAGPRDGTYCRPPSAIVMGKSAKMSLAIQSS
jgi:hypothetical protein